MISEKDIKFKKLSLISCKNIISLMDVSFAVVGRVDGEVFLCRQTFLERGTIPGRMVFCTGKTKVLDLDQSREAQAVPGGNVFEGTWGSCCHFRVPCQGMRELLCFSQTFWCHCHLIPVTSPLWRFASKPRICPPGHPQPPLPLPCSHRRGGPSRSLRLDRAHGFLDALGTDQWQREAGVR